MRRNDGSVSCEFFTRLYSSVITWSQYEMLKGSQQQQIVGDITNLHVPLPMSIKEPQLLPGADTWESLQRKLKILSSNSSWDRWFGRCPQMSYS